jgi:hypothetical protein
MWLASRGVPENTRSAVIVDEHRSHAETSAQAAQASADSPSMGLTGIVFTAACVWGAWNWYETRPLSRPAPGVVAAAEPVQEPARLAPLDMKGHRFQPLAHFRIRARVLSREDYRFDRAAKLSPTDLALGWGRMSDPKVYGQLDISQGGRFYYWRYQNEPPIPKEEIVRSSANMHLIPAGPAVRAALAKVRAGQVVSLEGELIEASHPSGWTWRSSLTREDSGAGACEVVLVSSLRIE